MTRSPAASTPARLLAAALAATLALAGCVASQVTGPQVPSDTALPSNFSVEYDAVLGTPRYVANLDATGGARPGVPAPFSDAVAFQIVRGFVLRYAPVFHVRPGVDDFVPTRFLGQDGQNIVKIQQTYRGVPVDVMGYGTTVLASGAVGSMIGRFMPDLTLSVSPGVRPAAATEHAIQALAPRAVHELSPPVLTILTEGPAPRLTWWVAVIQDASPWSWTVVVDARDGTVIDVRQNWIEG